MKVSIIWNKKIDDKMGNFPATIFQVSLHGNGQLKAVPAELKMKVVVAGMSVERWVFLIVTYQMQEENEILCYDS